MKVDPSKLLMPGSPSDLGDGYEARHINSESSNDGVIEIWAIFHHQVESAVLTMELDTYNDSWNSITMINDNVPQAVIDMVLERRNETRRTYYVLVGMCQYADCSDSKPRPRRIPVQAHSGRGALENLRRLVDREREAHDGSCVLGKSTHKYIGPVYANVLDRFRKQLYGQEIEYL